MNNGMDVQKPAERISKNFVINFKLFDTILQNIQVQNVIPWYKMT